MNDMIINKEAQKRNGQYISMYSIKVDDIWRKYDDGCQYMIIPDSLWHFMTFHDTAKQKETVGPPIWVFIYEAYQDWVCIKTFFEYWLRLFFFFLSVIESFNLIKQSFLCLSSCLNLLFSWNFFRESMRAGVKVFIIRSRKNVTTVDFAK